MRLLLALMLLNACIRSPHSGIRIIETSRSGHQLTEVREFPEPARTLEITLRPEQRFQTITGFGGSFTEASASLLNRMSPEKRKLIIDANFADSIDEDRDDIIPMIKDAMAASSEGFKIIASPWTAPPWMKDNNDWRGGKLLGFDQNRDEQLKIWVDAMYDDPEAAQYFDGTAVHWYASTVDYFPEALEYAKSKAPGKHLHPKYVPVFRYARDIIGSLNHHVDGWIDWNMVLDRQDGPNWAKNWCVAPVIVDPESDEVYFTPLYHTMAHFSTLIRPGAVRIEFSIQGNSI